MKKEKILKTDIDIVRFDRINESQVSFSSMNSSFRSFWEYQVLLVLSGTH